MTRRHRLALVALALTFAIVGNMDYADEKRERDHYCRMVEAEHWPDFKNLQGECDDEQHN